MTFKSLMIFALVASVGHVLAAPLARNPCQGVWCGPADISRRLAQFDYPNVTLSSGTPGTPTAVNPSLGPSSTPPVDNINTGIPEPTISTLPSLTSGGIPLATEPPAGDLVTVTIVSTVFLSPSDPVASPPVQSPAPGSLVPPNLPADPLSPPGTSPPATLTPVELTVAPSPTIIQLTPGVPSPVSSDPADQPTPTPTDRIIFLPPSGDGS